MSFTILNKYTTRDDNDYTTITIKTRPTQHGLQTVVETLVERDIDLVAVKYRQSTSKNERRELLAEYMELAAAYNVNGKIFNQSIQ